MSINNIFSMKKILNSVISFISLTAVAIGQNDAILKMLNNVPVEKNEILIITFVTPGECLKCNIMLASTFTWLEKKIPKRKPKFVGLIDCQREIELKQCAKEYPMFDRLLMDQENMRSQIRIDKTVRIVVFDHTGKILGVIGRQDFFDNIQTAFRRILQIK